MAAQGRLGGYRAHRRKGMEMTYTETEFEGKVTDRLVELEKLALASGEGNQAVFAALGDCRNALRRVVKRATVPDEFENVQIDQDKGPTVEFTGRLLASDEFETKGRDPLRIKMEIWETQAGHLVAASYAEPVDREGFENARVTVVKSHEPIEEIDVDGGANWKPIKMADPQAMRFAVMDAFDWHVRARSMAKKLGWSLRKDVE
jgi:hypothetical protein